jgi:type I restriction enzyme, S subunit
MAGARVNQHVCILRPTTKLLPRFLCYYLRSPDQQALVGSNQVGGTRQAVTKGMLLDWKIALPPIAEQQEIVELLDEADELRKLRAAADKRSATLIPALFIEMFGDPATNSKGWPVARLGEIAPLKSGYAFKSTDYLPTGVRLVRISNLDRQNLVFGDGTAHLSKSLLDEHPECQLSAGDVLIAMSGATTGKLGMVRPSDVPSLLNQRVGKFFIRDPKALEPTFLFNTLRFPAVTRRLIGEAAGSAQANVSPSGVGSVQIPLPPLGLQREYAERITEVRGMEIEQSANRQRLDDLFQSMLHRAFEGEL